MEAREQTIQFLTALKHELSQKRERLMQPIRDLDRQLTSVTHTLEVILQGPKRADDSPDNLLLRRIKNLTHVQALIEIAKFSGGVLDAQTAKVLMLRAGIMKLTPNSTHMVHGAIARSEAFVRVARGKYRLKEASGTRVISQITQVPMATDTLGSIKAQ